MEDFEGFTVSEVMEDISDNDLSFIAFYSPAVMHNLCLMWSLELQLDKEGKLSNKPVIFQTRKQSNRFVYLWYKFKEWLYSKFGKMGFMKR